MPHEKIMEVAQYPAAACEAGDSVSDLFSYRIWTAGRRMSSSGGYMPGSGCRKACSRPCESEK